LNSYRKVKKMQLSPISGYTLGLIILTTLFSTGCKKNYIISEKQAIVFQLDYINYSWGYEHNGFLIDYEGNVLTYNNPETWNFPDEDFIISKSQVAENIASCKRSGVRISDVELHKYTNYIKNIASSKVSAIKNVAADAGSLQFICYQLSENTGIYTGHLIKMEGDFTCENLNFFAKKTSSWMRDINSALNQK
jgi:hypothetical protein